MRPPQAFQKHKYYVVAKLTGIRSSKLPVRLARPKAVVDRHPECVSWVYNADRTPVFNSKQAINRGAVVRKASTLGVSISSRCLGSVLFLVVPGLSSNHPVESRTLSAHILSHRGSSPTQLHGLVLPRSSRLTKNGSHPKPLPA